MPDQVRHDMKKKIHFNNCDTASKAGIEEPCSKLQGIFDRKDF